MYVRLGYLTVQIWLRSDKGYNLGEHLVCHQFAGYLFVTSVILLLIIVNNDHRWPAMMVFYLSGSLNLSILLYVVSLIWQINSQYLKNYERTSVKICGEVECGQEGNN